MARRKNEIVFEAKVDFSEKDKLREGEGGRRVEEVVVKTLTVQLPEDLKRFFGLDVDIYIRGTRYGSLSVFFGVVLGAYGVLSGYKGLFESVELIRQQAADLLDAALGRIGEYNVSVKAWYPSDRGLERFLHRRMGPLFEDRIGRELFVDSSSPEGPSKGRRDGFFYFLLAMCIVEFLALALLVYRAVIHTYLTH